MTRQLERNDRDPQRVTGTSGSLHRATAISRPFTVTTSTMSSATPATAHKRVAHILQQLTPQSTAAATVPKSKHAHPISLAAHLATLTPIIGSDQALPSLLLSLAAASAEISAILRGSTVSKIGTANNFGDLQLNVDVDTHECVLRHLRSSGVCATASSEEDPRRLDLSASLAPNVGRELEYSVAFDPLDGSSIIDANFAVGSIFSVFLGRELLGQRVCDQKAAAITLYGPRTTIIFALPNRTVFEATLSPSDGRSWFLSRASIALALDTNIFAPANLRCAAEDAAYRRLVDHWLAAKYTLRYSGGLVPDFYHALIKGQGVFVSPTSTRSPAKLRLLFECASLSFIALQASGAAVDQNGNDMADVRVASYDQRSGLVIGSRNEVERYKMFRSQEKAASAPKPAS